MTGSSLKQYLVAALLLLLGLPAFAAGDAPADNHAAEPAYRVTVIEEAILGPLFADPGDEPIWSPLLASAPASGIPLRAPLGGLLVDPEYTLEAVSGANGSQPDDGRSWEILTEWAAGPDAPKPGPQPTPVPLPWAGGMMLAALFALTASRRRLA